MGVQSSSKTTPKSSSSSNSSSNSNTNSKSNSGAKTSNILKSMPTLKPGITSSSTSYNISPINTPWFYYYFLMTHNHHDGTRIDENEYYTIKDMTYDKEKSELFQTDYYNITFENGISTSEALQILKNKINTENKYVYLNIENTNIEVPVKKDDLKSWVNNLPEKTHNKTYTK